MNHMFVPDEPVRFALGYPELPSHPEMSDEIRKFKLELITQAGKLDFYEADTGILLAEIQLRKAETEKLAMQLSQLETRFNMFMLENRNEEK